MDIKILTAVIVATSITASLFAEKTIVTPEMRIARAGGLIERANTQKGKVAFIDTQKRFNATNIQSIAKALADETKVNITYERAEASDCPCKLKDSANADVAIVIIDDPAKPTSAVSPDDGWAMMNVAKLDVGLKTDDAKTKFFEKRCRRQLLRIYSLATGGWASNYPGNIMTPGKLQDLDLVDEFIPEDVKERTARFYKAKGITPKTIASYRKACHQGWAPPPTNDVQKAIWDKVHEVPSNPVKITFDKDKQKPVVK